MAQQNGPIPAFPEPALVTLPSTGAGADEIVLSVHEAGDGPAVLLCHGFPDLAIGWHNQLPALADAGFRAIAPDLRGYGGSARPGAASAYGMTELTGDLVGLLDALEIDQAVLVGHDWGGWVVWGAAVLHPERIAGVVGVCTPYLPFPSIAKHLELVDGDVERQYVAWFQEPGLAESVMDPQADAVMRRIMRTGAPPEQVIAAAFADGSLNMNPFMDPARFPDMGDPLGPPALLDHYCDVFGRTGFRGGINWYRNVDRNRSDHPDVGTVSLDLPALMITAEWDPALTPSMADGMRDRCSDLEIAMIAEAGHWVQQDKPDQLNAVLVDWLVRRFG